MKILDIIHPILMIYLLRPYSLRGTPKTGSERAGFRLMTEMAQLQRRRPGYGLVLSGMFLELELFEL